jgi:glycosyltransferase involved in cell wall biosynthesis
LINFIISKLNNSAPAKGLTAKVNLLSDHYDINLIILKSFDTFALEKISKKVKVVDLTEKNFIKKIYFLRKFIKNNSSSTDISYSLGFFSDFINIFFLKLDKKIISIRGSLHNTYVIDYGILGELLFRLHYWIASRASTVIVMTDLIAKKFEKYTKYKPKIVGNYIDEKNYSKIYNQNFINQNNKLKKFLFIGRFVNLKQPIQLINIFKKIKSNDYNFELDMYGEGPLKLNAIKMVNKSKLNENIKILDFQKNLWPKIKKNMMPLYYLL